MPNSSMAERRRELEMLPTQLLDQMLRKELQSDDGDPDVVNLILDILKAREKDKPTPIGSTEKIAWEKYMARTKEKEDRPTNKRIWALRVASIVLVVSVLFLSISSEATAEPFWERIDKWTDSVFAFFSPDEPTQAIEEYEFRTEHPGLQQVYDAVAELGVTEPVVPMWIPEGYSLIVCKKMDTEKKSTVMAAFQNSDKVISYNIAICSEEVTNQYQKDDTEETEFEHNGTRYHIIKNNKMWVIVRTMRNIECSISVDCQEEEVYKMIRSIYESEEVK